MDLPSTHFLSQPRPGVANASPGLVDTTTLAAHDFDVDTQTGFMPRNPPIARLPSPWDAWEVLFDDARSSALQIGEKEGLTNEEKRTSERWRATVRSAPLIGVQVLDRSEVVLRRAHLVLAWIMHFYIHTLPPNEEIIVPSSISIPLLVVSWALQIPPVLTYSDDVLYNWHLTNTSTSSPNALPTPETIEMSTTFTATPSESHFYLTSARIELVGVKALDLMSACLDEAFVGDAIAHRRITSYLLNLKEVIAELETILLAVKEGCDPLVFYQEIRPWFRGEDSSAGAGRKWKFEGLDSPELLGRGITAPTELSGASAGQSALIHALDIFLGVPTNQAFQQRMRTYMPRYHRVFLSHLEGRRGTVRGLVERARAISEGQEPVGNMGEEEIDSQVARDLVEAYNHAVDALKQFRNAHLRIVALYIVGPARRGALDRAISGHGPDISRGVGSSSEGSKEKKELKGTGGTDLVKFLKTVRDRTGETVLR